MVTLIKLLVMVIKAVIAFAKFASIDPAVIEHLQAIIADLLGENPEETTNEETTTL